MRKKDIREIIKNINYLIAEQDEPMIRNIIIGLHHADLAEILHYLNEENRDYIFSLLDAEIASDVIAEMDDISRDKILDDLDEERISEIVDEMDSDDATDLVSDLPAAIAHKVLGSIDKEDSDEVIELLTHKEDTAGGIMAKEFIAVNLNTTVDKVSQEIRKMSEEVEDIFYIYVVDENNKLVGIVSLKNLIIADSKTLISDIMDREVISVKTSVDQEDVANIAQKYDLKLIFDSAHAFGARYHGKSAGGFGNAEVFSLSPTKLLATGEGGIITTDDKGLAYNLRIGRDYANPGDYNCQFLALNARMPEFNAVLGLKNLENVEENVVRRNKLSEIYRANLEKLPGISFQSKAPDVRCTYKDLSILISPIKFGLSRDELAVSLAAENIGTKKYYDPPVHKQQFFTSLFGLNGCKLPATNFVSENIPSLPIFSHMLYEEVTGICRAIKRIYRYRRRIHYVLRSNYENKLLPDTAGLY